MQNHQTPRPILKPKPKILTVLARPLVGQQQSLDLGGVESSLPSPPRRVKSSLQIAIDYDKLTPTRQEAIDAGCFGMIELKEIHPGKFYYYLRWQDPQTGKKRSTYLGKDWAKAIEKRRQLASQLVT